MDCIVHGVPKSRTHDWALFTFTSAVVGTTGSFLRLQLDVSGSWRHPVHYWGWGICSEDGFFARLLVGGLSALASGWKPEPHQVVLTGGPPGYLCNMAVDFPGGRGPRLKPHTTEAWKATNLGFTLNLLVTSHPRGKGNPAPLLKGEMPQNLWTHFKFIAPTLLSFLSSCGMESFLGWEVGWMIPTPTRLLGGFSEIP